MSWQQPSGGQITTGRNFCQDTWIWIPIHHNNDHNIFMDIMDILWFVAGLASSPKSRDQWSRKSPYHSLRTIQKICLKSPWVQLRAFSSVGKNNTLSRRRRRDLRLSIDWLIKICHGAWNLLWNLIIFHLSNVFPCFPGLDVAGRVGLHVAAAGHMQSFSLQKRQREQMRWCRMYMSRPGPNGIFLKIAMEMNKANTCKYSMYTFVHKHQHVTPEWMKRFVFHISTSTMIYTYTH